MVTDRDRTVKVFFGRPVIASGNLSVRIFIILFSRPRRSTFQKTLKIFKPRITRMRATTADHCQFWCLLTGPAESKPNRRITKAKTIGVMLMAFSLIDKKSPDRESRAERRATDSKPQTKRKRPSLSLEQFYLSSCHFLKLLKTEISRNVKFLSRRCEVKGIRITASGPED
jgi:hypothetical protein